MALRMFAPARALILVATLAMAACSRQAEVEAPAAPTAIRIDGSSTVLPITQVVVTAFNAQNPAAVEAIASGTRAGFEKFCTGEADIIGASRPITSTEIIACFRGGVRYIEAPVAFDGITVIVHPSNPIRSATIDQLRAAWAPGAQGVVATWRQANAAWPDTPLALFGPGAESGTFEYFTHTVMGQTGHSRTDYTASEDDDFIVNSVAADPNAMGYVGFAYYERNHERLKALAIDSDGGPVTPSAETIANGSYHPLSRPVFIYVNSAALDRPEVAQFAEFYINNAGAASREAGYVPLPDSAYPVYLERIQNRRRGTAFSGREPTGLTIEEVIAQPLIEPTS